MFNVGVLSKRLAYVPLVIIKNNLRSTRYHKE